MWGLRFKCLTRKPPSSTWTQQHRQQSEKAEWRIVGLVVGTQRRQWRSLYLQHLRHMTVLFCFWDFLVSISWKDVGLVLFQGSHDGRQSVKTCKHSHPWRHYRPIISGYWCRTWPCNSGEPSRTHKASTAWKIHESKEAQNWREFHCQKERVQHAWEKRGVYVYVSVSVSVCFYETHAHLTHCFPFSFILD